MAPRQMVLWADDLGGDDDLVTRLVEIVDDLNEVLDELDRCLGLDDESRASTR